MTPLGTLRVAPRTLAVILYELWSVSVHGSVFQGGHLLLLPGPLFVLPSDEVEQLQLQTSALSVRSQAHLTHIRSYAGMNHVTSHSVSNHDAANV